MGDNTGSDHIEEASPTPKKNLHLKVKKPEVENFKKLSQRLKKTQRLTLARKYGKILDLLEVDILVEAITAVAQYYDPPLRCFTFKDFQLAPTLEEFERILGLPFDEKPYRYLGHYPSLQTVASVLKVSVMDLHEAKQNRNGTEGFPKKYLEEHLSYLAKVEDWDTFIDVLALAIYGILLFPNINGLVDFATIDVFFARKFRGENPVTAVLANVYCTFDFCHERKGKRILCCLPMLFTWLTAHLFKRGYEVPCPIVDLQSCQLKARSGSEWSQTLAELDEKSVRWYPQWAKVDSLIYKCGDFPNVPLMGTRGCINYNPCLALRQLGYPMKEAPTEDKITPFIIYDMNPEHIEILRRVRNAWNEVIRKGKELGVRSCWAKEVYRHWVWDRAKKVKLPFQIRTIDKPPVPVSLENEEMAETKKILAKTEEEKKMAEKELVEMRQMCETLKRENVKKNHTLERAPKKAKIKKNLLLKTSDCLTAANSELGLRRQERDKALVENEELKNLLRSAVIAQKDAQRQATDAWKQVKMIIVECEEKMKREKHYTDEEIMRYQDMIQKGQEDVQNLINHVREQNETIIGDRQEVIFWMTRFSNLVLIANKAIEEVPDLLKMADVMVNPLSTPVEICDFIEHCKDLIKRMKELIVNKT